MSLIYHLDFCIYIIFCMIFLLIFFACSTKKFFHVSAISYIAMVKIFFSIFQLQFSGYSKQLKILLFHPDVFDENAVCGFTTVN